MGDETFVGSIESPTTSTVSLRVLGHSYGRSLHALWLMALIKRWTCTSHNAKNLTSHVSLSKPPCQVPKASVRNLQLYRFCKCPFAKQGFA